MEPRRRLGLLRAGRANADRRKRSRERGGEDDAAMNVHGPAS